MMSGDGSPFGGMFDESRYHGARSTDLKDARSLHAVPLPLVVFCAGVGAVLVAALALPVATVASAGSSVDIHYPEMEWNLAGRIAELIHTDPTRWIGAMAVVVCTLACGFLLSDRASNRVTTGLGLTAAVYLAIGALTTRATVDEVANRAADGTAIEVAPGVWVALAGAAVMGAAAIWGLRDARRRLAPRRDSSTPQ
jgi:hypothetical protein